MSDKISNVDITDLLEYSNRRPDEYWLCESSSHCGSKEQEIDVSSENIEKWLQKDECDISNDVKTDLTTKLKDLKINASPEFLDQNLLAVSSVHSKSLYNLYTPPPTKKLYEKRASKYSSRRISCFSPHYHLKRRAADDTAKRAKDTRPNNNFCPSSSSSSSNHYCKDVHFSSEIRKSLSISQIHIESILPPEKGLSDDKRSLSCSSSNSEFVSCFESQKSSKSPSRDLISSELSSSTSQYFSPNTSPLKKLSHSKSYDTSILSSTCATLSKKLGAAATYKTSSTNNPCNSPKKKSNNCSSSSSGAHNLHVPQKAVIQPLIAFKKNCKTEYASDGEFDIVACDEDFEMTLNQQELSMHARRQTFNISQAHFSAVNNGVRRQPVSRKIVDNAHKKAPPQPYISPNQAFIRKKINPSTNKASQQRHSMISDNFDKFRSVSGDSASIFHSNDLSSNRSHLYNNGATFKKQTFRKNTTRIIQDDDECASLYTPDKGVHLRSSSSSNKLNNQKSVYDTTNDNSYTNSVCKVSPFNKSTTSNADSSRKLRPPNGPESLQRRPLKQNIANASRFGYYNSTGSSINNNSSTATSPKNFTERKTLRPSKFLSQHERN